MTAEIGVLNKTSVILAADSAATISAHKKVFNNANKLFPLSDFEPIGIMVYNVSNWMGIPLELIIKGYKAHLGPTSFPTLLEYCDDYIKFIKDNFRSYIDKGQINDVVENRLHQMLDELSDSYKLILEDVITDDNLAEKEKISTDIFLDVINEGSVPPETILNDFIDYTFENFKNDFKESIDKILPGFYIANKIQRKSEYTKKIYKLLYYDVIKPFSTYEDFSGIVIAGYGKDEIYPTISEFKIGDIISDRVRYEYKRTRSISHKNTAIIAPFAQREMVDTYFRGINPKIFSEIGTIIKTELLEAIDIIHKKYPKVPKSELKDILSNAENNSKKKILDFSDTNYIKPIVKSIGYLRKEDLIEFAESLINMTSLKLKTHSELQSVGGPIDIAIITKYEGFVWIKRKEEIK